MAVLDGRPTKASVFDLEQAVHTEESTSLLTQAVEGSLELLDLLADHFVRDLHRRLYGGVWTWAGTYRRREMSIGVAPEMIAVELRSELESIAYRWTHTSDWSPQVLGVAVHAAVVRVHPFVDGNGRATRLLADAVLASATRDEEPQVYEWEVDRKEYLRLLRQYDRDRDPQPLSGFLTTRPLLDPATARP